MCVWPRFEMCVYGVKEQRHHQRLLILLGHGVKKETKPTERSVDCMQETNLIYIYVYEREDVRAIERLRGRVEVGEGR